MSPAVADATAATGFAGSIAPEVNTTGFGVLKFEMVENVKDFCAKLQSNPFRNQQLLCQRNIRCGQAGTIQEIARRIAPCSGQRCDEGVGIEVPIRITKNQVATEIGIE